MRRSGWQSLAGVALLALAACGENASGANKTDQSSAAHIAAALNICARPDDPFAQDVCNNRALAALDTQMRDALTAQSSKISDAGAQLLVQNQARWREAQR